MTKRIRLSLIIVISIVFMAISALLIIVVNSPYYRGFEGELNYLSPDLSENSAIIRDTINLSKKSVIKIVFEKKYNQIRYSRIQFERFLKDIEVQVWNENEYYSYEFSDNYEPELGTTFFDIPIGDISGKGKYYIYIKSDLGVNAAYNIGVGIGRESFFNPIGSNSRRFY